MTSVTVVDIPCSVANDKGRTIADGSIRKRVMIFIKGNSDGTSHPEKLTDWVPELQDVEGIVSFTINDTAGATATPLTWSTTTLTYANHTAAGKQEVCLIGRVK